MTLCTAWIRPTPADNDELVLATDSRLTGGEEWDHGMKLFSVGRPDALLCFAGGTSRAYPLILQAVEAPRINTAWNDPRLDLYDVLEAVMDSFTKLARSIRNTVEDVHQVRAEASFLFGGWSWRRQDFGVWRLYYKRDVEAFTADSLYEPDGTAPFQVFMGDDETDAHALLSNEIEKAGKTESSPLDMEPFRVVSRMARDREKHPTIGGALQVAKVYRSGYSEFFGVLWPSSVNGKPHMLGRPVDPYDAPQVRLLDPDTGLYVDRVPMAFTGFDAFDFGDEVEFVRGCYPAPADRLNQSLSEARRDRLERVLRGAAYDGLRRDHGETDEPGEFAAEEYAEEETDFGAAPFEEVEAILDVEPEPDDTDPVDDPDELDDVEPDQETDDE